MIKIPDFNNALFKMTCLLKLTNFNRVNLIFDITLSFQVKLFNNIY